MLDALKAPLIGSNTYNVVCHFQLVFRPVGLDYCRNSTGKPNKFQQTFLTPFRCRLFVIQMP